jgi:hypothetical protein
MRGLDPRIHAFHALEGVDGRDKPGQDETQGKISSPIPPRIFSPDRPAASGEG